MKKLLGIFAVATVLTLGMVGCGNPDLPDDYEMPCVSDGCEGDNANK